MVVIKDQFDPELRRHISKYQTAIIPVGAIEQHGPHLPISTDSDIVTAVAEKICEKKKYLLLPTIHYGVSFEHAPFFNLSLKESTLKKVIMDLAESLVANNIRNIFVINGHYGNQKALKLDGNPRVFVISYWNHIDEFDHAGRVETSLMLAISKNVKMSKCKKGFIEPLMSRSEKTALQKKAAKSFIKVTGNGIWGDPRTATKKEGREILEKIVKSINKTIQINK